MALELLDFLTKHQPDDYSTIGGGTSHALQAFKLYNTEKLDFSLFFCSHNARQLQEHLSASDLAAGEHPLQCAGKPITQV